MTRTMHNNRIFFILLVFAAGLSSCGITKQYELPEPDTNGLFRDEYPTDTNTIAAIPWREYFRDVYLQELIEEGLRNNYDMRIAITRISQAEANLAMARAAFFPTVGAAAQVTHSRYSNGERGKDVLGYYTNQYNLGVAVSWEADLWGKLNSQARAQYAQWLNSYAYRNLIRTSLIANIANSYYSLLALDEQLLITRETVNLLQESVETMQALKDAGMQNGAAVEQSKSLLYSTQATIPDLESQIRQTENALSILVARKPGPIERSTLFEQQVPEELETGIPVQMLARRPDVRQAELGLRAAFELTNAARAAFYPSVSLSEGSLFGYGSSTLSHFFKPENLLVNVIGSITQPIFARKQLTGNLQIARAQQEEALLTFEQTVLEAGQEVSDIIYSFHSSLSKNDIRDNQIQATMTSVYFTQELLVAGEANYTEVLTAEQNLLQAQLSQISDRLEQLQYTVNLYRALGGGTE